MLTIVRINNGVPTGWIVATDIDDARRQAQGSGDRELAQLLYTAPPEQMLPNKAEILPGCWLLR